MQNITIKANVYIDSTTEALIELRSILVNALGEIPFKGNLNAVFDLHEQVGCMIEDLEELKEDIENIDLNCLNEAEAEPTA